MDEFEFSRAAPGAEFTPPPAEFGGGGAPEFQPLPPEYRQGSGSNETKPKKRRKWKQLIAAVLTGVVGMTVFFGGKLQPDQPGPDSPSNPGADPTEPAVTDVIPTETEPAAEPTQPPVDFTLEGAAELYIMKEEPEVAYGFFNGHLKLTSGDEAALDLTPELFTVNWYDGAGNLLGSDQATEFGSDADAYLVNGALPEMKADPEGGWRFPYDGFFNIAGRPEAAATYSVALQVRDRNTGYTTTVESNQIGEPTYPLGSGQIVVTVYNDTDTWNVPSVEGAPTYGLTVLYYGTFDEADFTELALPKPVSPDPLKAFPSGQFIHYGNRFDNGAAQMTDADPFVFQIHEYDTEGNAVLTRKDVALIPPSADGNRYVNVHTAWQSEDDPCLVLDSPETDQHWEYNPYVFTYSEGYAYIDAYGMPWKEGLWFVGWFDDEGNQVHILSYIDHCDRLPGATGDGEDDIDWRSFHTITLHAVFVEE